MNEHNIFNKTLRKCDPTDYNYYTRGYCKRDISLYENRHTINNVCVIMNEQLSRYLTTQHKIDKSIEQKKSACISEYLWKSCYLDGIDVEINEHATNISSHKTYNFMKSVSNTSGK